MRTPPSTDAAPLRRPWILLPLIALLAACPSGQRPGSGNPASSSPAGAPVVPGAVPAGLAGVRAAQQGDLDSAEPLLVQALAESPDDVRVLEALGFVYAHTDRWQKAQATYERALTVRPGSPGALYGLGSVLADTGRYPEALEVIRRLLAADPGNQPARLKEALLLARTGDPSAVERARALAQSAPDQAEPHYILGLALEQSGDLEGAAAEFRRAVAIQPAHLGALARLQPVLTRLGRKEEAAKAGEAHREALARQRVEERVRGHRNRGVEAFNRQDYEGALAEFAVIEREDPNDPQVHLYKGSALLALGRRPEARAALVRSLALQPRNERAYMEMGRLEALDDHLDAAVAALRQAIAINPEFAEPHYFLAGILQAQGDAQGSTEEMRRFQALKAKTPAAAMELSNPPAGAPR